MKHFSSAFRSAIGKLVVLVVLLSSPSLFGQASVQTHSPQPEQNYGDSLAGFNEAAVRNHAVAKGLHGNEINLYVSRAKRTYIDHQYYPGRAGHQHNSLASMRQQDPDYVQTACTNMDFESGTFAGWSGFIGDNTVSSNGPLQNITAGFFTTGTNAAYNDMNARHTIEQAPGAGNDFYGGFPCVFPGGVYSVRLGNDYGNYQGEAIEQTFTVGPGNTSFTYSYAAVLNDGGHSAGEQPYFRIEMFDQSGNLIPCGQYYVEAAGGNTPGFVQSATSNVSDGTPIYYKPWTTVNIDLTANMGQNVTIRFTAAGCIYGGHFGYAYVDASCLPYTISASDSLCVGGSITLSAPVGAASYQWSTGSTNQSITVNSAGSYSVTMTSVTGCQTTLTRNVGMYPQPTAAFTPNGAACTTLYTFANSSSISSGTLSYHWDFGDPSVTNDTSNVANPSWNYGSTGTFTVTLIVTSSSGCTDSITSVVTPGGSSIASFSNTTVCVGQPTTFTDQSNNPTSWSWHFGDPSVTNDSSNVQNPTWTYNSPGTYTVTLTVGGNPCPGTIQNVVTVNPLPTASFVYNQICGNQLVNFTSTSTVASPDVITSTTWNFGDPASGGNNTSTLLNPSHTFTAAGTYTVSITVNTQGGCPQTSQQVIAVGVPPTAQFVANTVCTNTPMQFTDQSQNTVNWLWNFGDPAAMNDTSNVQNPNYTYTTAGTYTVTLIANPGPCSDTSTLAVTVASGPQVQFTAPVVCLGNTTSFTDQSNIASGNITGWSWDFGVAAQTNDTSNVQNPTYTYATAGNFNVTLTCTSNNGCVTTATLPVTVNGLPTANFNSTVVCQGSPTTLNDLSVANGGNITSWTWDFGDGSPVSATQNPTHTYANDSTYNVTLIVTNTAGCIDTVVIPVTTAAQPVVLFTADTLDGCPILCVDFSDLSTVNSGSITGWTWDFGDGSPNAYTQNPSHCFSTTGTYTITLTTTSNNGCVQTLVIPDMIEVYPVPTASFAANPQHTDVLNTQISYFDNSQGNPVQWSWNFGDPSTLSDTSSLQNTTYAYSDEAGGTYPVYLQVTNQYGCVDDTSLEVIVDPNWSFYIPNAFTPNGDGVNDLFFGKGTGITDYEIWVFDRWGNLIFTTTDINEGWDGTVQGKSGEICQEDVYVWKVVLRDVFNKKHKYIGHVSLIK
jgi:gliding motility-associated-like protein